MFLVHAGAERNRAAPDSGALLKERSEIRGDVGTLSPGVDRRGTGDPALFLRGA